MVSECIIKKEHAGEQQDDYCLYGYLAGHDNEMREGAWLPRGPPVKPFMITLSIVT